MSLLAPETIDLCALPSVAFAARTQLPNIAALYFVHDAESQILYVGRTKSLCFRWVSHHLNDELSLLPDIHIAYLAVTDPVQLSRLEYGCIKRFAPSFNRSKKAHQKDSQLITIRFPKDVLEHYRHWAAMEHRSLNGQLLHVLKAYMAGTALQEPPCLRSRTS